MKLQSMVIIGLALLTAAGCKGTMGADRAAADRHPIPRPDPVLTMLHKGVIELSESIEELKRDIADLEQLPAFPDPQVQRLHDLDLAAWRLHLQQWTAQRDRLRSAIDSIEKAQADPQHKAAIGEQWAARQAEFMKTVEELRTQRRALEQQRAEVEMQVLGRYFK